jgi:Isoleucyl-tRNA synthetase (EC 6.1.1.5)
MPGDCGKLIAPISPFFSDLLFTNLNAVTGRHKEESVHHVSFPRANPSAIDASLEERMQMAQDLSSLILSLRKKVNIKVRQPLQKALIPVLNKEMMAQIQKVEDLIKSEVNIKEIQYLQEDNGFIKKKIKPNYTVLGKKLGAKMKPVAAALAGFTQEQIAKLEKEGSISLQIDNEPLILQLNEVEITSEDIPGWMVANKDTLTVALDVTVTPELISEGNARELVNRIQKIRKDSGYELTDRILVKVTDHHELKQSIARFNNYICAEILADKLELVPELHDGTEIEVNEIPLKVFVTKKFNSMAPKKKAAKPAKKPVASKKPAAKPAAKKLLPKNPRQNLPLKKQQSRSPRKLLPNLPVRPLPRVK